MNIFKKEDINSHIVFLGYGELRDKMIQESDKYVKIHVHDAVPHEKVIPIAKSADIGLCFIQNISLSDYYCLLNFTILILLVYYFFYFLRGRVFYPKFINN
jgi:hypothetical protein